MSKSVVKPNNNDRTRLTHLLEEFSCEVFNHPPYSRDLAPSDFHLLLHLKQFLTGQAQRFASDRVADMSVTQWFQSQAADFYETGTQKMVPLHDECLNSGGEYIEK